MNDHIRREIEFELARQDSKWGSQRKLPADTWVRILGEEFGEVCKAINERQPSQYRAELVQVAAVAIQAIESLEAQPRHNPVPQAPPGL